MTPMIIDTDPGVDDAFALALAALSPDVELLAVTTVFGNVPLAATTRNALRVLALCGREDVPVAAGADRPLVFPHPNRATTAHGDDGLSGRAGTLPERSRGVEPVDAVTLLADLLAAASEPVTIVPVGPLTNIALLLAAHPALRAKIARLVVMGGGLTGGNTTPSAEFNIWSDPEAARRVLVEENLPTVLVPIDLTYKCAVDGQWLSDLAASGPVGEALVGLTPDYRAHYRRSLGWDGVVLHDAVAVAEAIQPGMFETTAYPLEVDCTQGPGRGTVIADRRLAPAAAPRRNTVEVALDTDLDALRRFVFDRLSPS